MIDDLVQWFLLDSDGLWVLRPGNPANLITRNPAPSTNGD